MTRLALALLAMSVLACAQARQPPGGTPVDRPPRVVETTPEPFSVVTRLDRPVVIRFDERLSERLDGVRQLSEAVIVSPETGAVRVRRGRRHLEVSVAGGWQPDHVYRVVVLPVFRDLFNNVLTEPIELVFSTGAPIPETAVAGLVEDRLTGRPVARARIEATHGDAAYSYVAIADTAGFFALRHVPAGPYDLRGWLDQNRNRIADFSEPQDTARFALADGDTVIVELQLLPRDTMPARLLRAQPIDSVRVELGFDDYFAPGSVDGTAAVYLLADSTFVTRGALFHATKLDSMRAAERAVARAAADREAVAADQDTAIAVPDPPAPARQEVRPEPRRAETPSRRPLPARELILVLPARLEPATRYYVDVSGVTNIHGLPGGGGSAAFRTPAAPPPEDTDPPPEDTEPPPEDTEPPPEDADPPPEEARPPPAEADPLPDGAGPPR